MFKSAWIANFCPFLLVISPLAFGGSVWAQEEDACEALKGQQQALWAQQADLRELLVGKSIDGAEVLQLVHQQLVAYEGGPLGDVEIQKSSSLSLASSFDKVSESLFERADEIDQLAMDWIDVYPSCGWDHLVDDLEAWQATSYESLSTVAAFYSGYSIQIQAWPGEWDNLQLSKRTVRRQDFHQVREVRKGLEESGFLIRDTFKYLDKAFSAARP